MLIDSKLMKEKYLETIKKEWRSAQDTFPNFLSKISIEKQQENEIYLQAKMKDFQNLLLNFPRIPMLRKKWKNKMILLVNDFLYNEVILGIHHSMTKTAIDSFQEELKEFLRQVRIFSPELSFEEIGQAIRNYIVYAMFKEIHRDNSGFSMAGFGYSMLYPFTDNFIDNIATSKEDKSEYNKIIYNKISGNPIHPRSQHHQKTCDLLQAIETEYPRDQDSTIYQLLLMMLEAQEQSLRQQDKSVLLSSDERLDISLYKGGISVLIDRFFVKKELTETDLILYLGMGFFLQMADDLQDIEEDSRKGHQTIMTLDLNSKQEEKLVNKLLHFIHNIMNSYQAENNLFKEFVLNNCYQLIFTSIIGSKQFFSTEYLEKIDQLLPISRSFYENFSKGLITNQDHKLQDHYKKMLDEII